MFSSEYILGASAYRRGKSIHFNPYRERGTAAQYNNWEKGWKDAEKKHQEKVKPT